MKQQNISLFQLFFLLLIAFKFAGIGNITASYWWFISGYVIVRVANAFMTDEVGKAVGEWWYIERTKHKIKRLDKKSRELIEKVLAESQEKE